MYSRHDKCVGSGTLFHVRVCVPPRLNFEDIAQLRGQPPVLPSLYECVYLHWISSTVSDEAVYKLHYYYLRILVPQLNPPILHLTFTCLISSLYRYSNIMSFDKCKQECKVAFSTHPRSVDDRPPIQPTYIISHTHTTLNVEIMQELNSTCRYFYMWIF